MGQPSFAERVIALLTEQRFARDDVEDLLAVLLLAKAQRDLDDDAAALVGRFAARAGIPPGTSGDAAAKAIDAYLAKKPPSEAIIAALSTLAREVASEGSDVGQALGKFAGLGAPGVLGGGGARPEGTVPGGPMARFLVKKP